MELILIRKRIEIEGTSLWRIKKQSILQDCKTKKKGVIIVGSYNTILLCIFFYRLTFK